MDRLPPTFGDHGRPDLTAEVLIDRRDQFSRPRSTPLSASSAPRGPKQWLPRRPVRAAASFGFLAPSSRALTLRRAAGI